MLARITKRLARQRGKRLAIFITAVLFVACVGSVAPDGGTPAITVTPATGGAGTAVMVTGVGFPAGTPLSVRLGPPDVGASPQTYADAVAGADGTVALTFAMPGRWPDGRAITERDLVVVVLNEDGSVKATTPFTFLPGS